MKIKIGRYRKDEKKRKIKIEIDPYDTWALDHTLSLIAVPLLKQLKETKHGAPPVDDEDVPEELRSTSAKPKENEWDIDSNHFARWDWVMDEMIWAHEQVVKDDDSEFYDESNVDTSKPFFEQVEQTKFNSEGYDAYNKRIDNGLRLFGKYYRGLWD